MRRMNEIAANYSTAGPGARNQGAGRLGGSAQSGLNAAEPPDVAEARGRVTASASAHKSPGLRVSGGRRVDARRPEHLGGSRRSGGGIREQGVRERLAAPREDRLDERANVTDHPPRGPAGETQPDDRGMDLGRPAETRLAGGEQAFDVARRPTSTLSTP